MYTHDLMLHFYSEFSSWSTNYGVIDDNEFMHLVNQGLARYVKAHFNNMWSPLRVSVCVFIFIYIHVHGYVRFYDWVPFSFTTRNST